MSGRELLGMKGVSSETIFVPGGDPKVSGRDSSLVLTCCKTRYEHRFVDRVSNSKY